MKQPKRTFCKIYLPRLSYSKTTLQLSPYCPTTYSLPQHHLLSYHLLPYYLLPCYLLLTTAPLTTLSLTTLLLTTLLLTPYHSTTYYLITYYPTTYYPTTHSSTTCTIIFRHPTVFCHPQMGHKSKIYYNFAKYFGTREECLSWFCITKIPHPSKF